jgi:heme-degrading monooxygenase HmoA
MSFVAIYRWTIEEAHRDSFRDRWREATLRLRELGGLGSCLTRDEKGDFVAIALWESEQAREQAFAAMTPLPPQAGVVAFEESRLEVEDDLWAVSPFEKA